MNLVEQASACNRGFSPGSGGVNPSTRPSVVLRSRRQASRDGIVLDIPGNTPDLVGAAHPTIVRFRLPEGPPCLANKQVSRTRGSSFDTPHQFARIDKGSDQHVNMIGYHNPSKQFVQTVVIRAIDDVPANQVCDIRPTEPHRTFAGCIQISIHPNECLSRRRVARSGVTALRQTAVEMPCDEQYFTFGQPVRKPSASICHFYWWFTDRKILIRPGLKSRLQAEACSTTRSV